VVMFALFMTGALQPIVYFAAWAFALLCVLVLVAGGVWVVHSVHWRLVGRHKAWQQLQAFKARNLTVSREHSSEVEALLPRAKSCPSCGAPPRSLDWVYYSSSPESWERLMGRRGWITLCNRCQQEVQSIWTIIN
jgi:hypothetical protein